MPSSEAASPIADGDLLAILLTAEGLLFAALAVGVTLQTLTEGNYLPPFVKKGWLAFSIASVTTLVAVGAGATWWRIFSEDCPEWFVPFAGAAALAVAIVAQPVLAFVIWLGMRKS